MNTENDDKPRILTAEEKIKRDKAVALNKLFNNSFNTKTADLKEYLLSINQVKADDALKALVQIAKVHKSGTQVLFNVDDVRYERVKATSIKKAMQELQPLLERLSKKLKSIPISDLALFNTMMHEIQSRYIKQTTADDNPTISFTKLIDEAYENTKDVVQEQSNHMKNSTDKDRTVLACNVALVIEKILKLNVSTSLHTNLGVNPKPKNALYARLLDMTLKLADESSVDMQKLMAAGIALSKDRSLPHSIK